MNIGEVISQPLRPGLDAFSLRHQGWTAERLLRFFHENSIVRAMVSLAQAEELVETVGEDRLDLQLSVALGSVICDTAAITDPNAARDACLALSDRLRRANAVGVNVARVNLLPMGRSSRVEGVEPFEAAFQILERALSTFRYDGFVAVENHRDLLAADLANLITRSS